MTRKQTSRVRVVGARVVLHLMALCYRMDDIVLRFKHLASENHSIVTYYSAQNDLIRPPCWDYPIKRCRKFRF